MRKANVFLQETLTKHEEDGTTDSKEYEEAMGVFYARHVCRMDPMPKDVADSFAGLAQDNTVYYTMCVTILARPLALFADRNAI